MLCKCEPKVILMVVILIMIMVVMTLIISTTLSVRLGYTVVTNTSEISMS